MTPVREGIEANEAAPQSRFRGVLERLRQNVAGARAIVVAASDGMVLDQVSLDPAADVDLLAAEFAMLLRIAGRTSEDTGSGGLVEHILVSEKAITIARHISPEQFLILVFDIQDQIGRARYEMKQAAWELGLK